MANAAIENHWFRALKDNCGKVEPRDLHLSNQFAREQRSLRYECFRSGQPRCSFAVCSSGCRSSSLPPSLCHSLESAPSAPLYPRITNPAIKKKRCIQRIVGPIIHPIRLANAPRPSDAPTKKTKQEQQRQVTRSLWKLPRGRFFEVRKALAPAREAAEAPPSAFARVQAQEAAYSVPLSRVPVDPLKGLPRAP